MASGRRPGKVTDEELLAAAALAPNMRQLLLALGIAAYGGNYESIRRRLARHDALHPGLKVSLRPYIWTDEAVRAAVAAGLSAAASLRSLGTPQSSSAQRVLLRRIAVLGISTEHWTGQAWSRGRRLGRREPLEALLVDGRTLGTDRLRRRLLEDGVLPHACVSCQRSEWRGRPIPLELDHINGNRRDNRLENLRLLCPNCHAQTETYRGRNIGRGAPPRPAAAVFCGRHRLARILRA